MDERQKPIEKKIKIFTVPFPIEEINKYTNKNIITSTKTPTKQIS